MSTHLLDIQNRASAMHDELAPMTLDAAIGWGASRFGGTALDTLYTRLMLQPDGSPSDVWTEAGKLAAWCEWLREFAEIIVSKAPAPEPPPVDTAEPPSDPA